ncbi:Site-specific DNA recombinase [Mariprofundus aestuarium]|uniref:Site-specific DNA recombinase n=1 Tax=Mariprofundus aestuarium TaxID=1921086 RepID=A0A2K8KZ05_MARES|nr:recombinase family protein [Mariprofundus aestuarium]ATX80225.1 Site-specific DNA recombinase [Mariprofundus aestuarium]
MAVALYARVSTARQAEKDLSIPDQLKQMRAWCKSQGYTVAMEYVEAGASATDDKRPEFQRMIGDATHSPTPFEGIIVHSLSRFFRDSLEFGLYERKLNKAGVKLVSITQQTSDDPSGEMARKIFNVFDEYQSKENGKHTQRAMKENARQGFWNGSTPPFGYRTEEVPLQGRRGNKKRLRLDPAESNIVKKIFNLYLNGHRGTALGLRSIATHLNERGLLKRGKSWGKTEVCNVLSNPIYKGEYYFNKRDSKSKKLKPEIEWIKLEVDKVVSAKLFDRARARSAARAPAKVPPRLVNTPTLLTGFLKCGCCGGSMTLATGKGGKYKYYKCTTRINKGTKACNGQSVPMENLDALILERMADKILIPSRIEMLLKEMRQKQTASRTTEKEEIGKLTAELKDLEKKRNRLFAAVEEGILPLDGSLKRRAHKQQVRHQEILTEIAGYRRSQYMPLKAIHSKHIENFSVAMRQRLLNRESCLGKEYLKLLVDNIIVDGKVATISGSYSALANALTQTTGGVPSFVPNWLPKQDSNKRTGE